jgi:hypothetical protein
MIILIYFKLKRLERVAKNPKNYNTLAQRLSRGKLKKFAQKINSQNKIFCAKINEKNFKKVLTKYNNNAIMYT